MMRLDIKLDKKLSLLVKNLKERLPEVLDKATKDTASYGKGQIIRSTAKGRTGLTQGGWAVNRVQPMAYMIWNRLKHALYLETGTGIYGPRHRRIVPIFGKYLRFPIWNRNTVAGWVTTESVAGMEAQPAIKPNVEKIQKDLNIRVRNAIRKLWKASKVAA